MRIQIASDLHFEKHLDDGSRFCAILKEAEPDVLVVAGDLAEFDWLQRSLEVMSENFRQVVYVIGNHECYGANIATALELARRICDRLKNVHLLNESILELGGVRFVGATMWFPYPLASGPVSEWAMQDFEAISGLREDVGASNRSNVAFLERTVRPGDVVVTHHLPSQSVVHPKWRRSPLNSYFVCDVEHVMLKQKPAAWIFGHTHESRDVLIGETRALCNPFGYLTTQYGPRVNPSFDEAFILELP